MKNLKLTAAVAALLLTGVSSTHASELIYGFNDATLNGFTLTYDGSDNGDATVAETTTGVTEGTGAIDIHTGSGAGYTQTDVGTTTLPADFIAAGTTSLNLDLTFNPGAVAYAYISPVFFLEGTGVDKKLLPAATATGENAHLEGTTYADTTLTYNLQAYKDPYGATDGDGTTALYTPGQIAAAVDAANPSSGAVISSFAFEIINGASSGLDYDIDNVTIPTAATPEPASLGLIAAGGLILGRRRRTR